MTSLHFAGYFALFMLFMCSCKLWSNVLISIEAFRFFYRFFALVSDIWALTISNCLLTIGQKQYSFSPRPWYTDFGLQQPTSQSPQSDNGQIYEFSQTKSRLIIVYFDPNDLLICGKHAPYSLLSELVSMLYEFCSQPIPYNCCQSKHSRLDNASQYEIRPFAPHGFI